MDHLFTPWRFAYVSAPRAESGCVLCTLGAAADDADAANLVIHRGRHAFVVLNLYPYNTGHVMAVPYAHVARLSALAGEALAELASLTARLEHALFDAYRPEGMNVGLNLGQAAGAGIADHLHVHLVPRWASDTNFMTVAGETRVLPESLRDTWQRLRGRL
jgi:ATP adenylyltransferase